MKVSGVFLCEGVVVNFMLEECVQDLQLVTLSEVEEGVSSV